MSETDRCPVCGAEYPVGLPFRICVSCLARAAEEDDREDEEEEESEASEEDIEGGKAEWGEPKLPESGSESGEGDAASGESGRLEVDDGPGYASPGERRGEGSHDGDDEDETVEDRPPGAEAGAGSGGASAVGVRSARPRRRSRDPFHPYRLIRSLGHGGFAEVFLARQLFPIEREVALKVLKGGSRDARVAERFELERQALARMNHPNICRIFDAATAEDGTPFFVMEVVEGEMITRYCRKHDLSLREVVRLFLEVCEGVRHAHQRGILHRDLKPSNIIVTERTGRPTPVVIDFGIAKALEPLIDSGAVLTGALQVVGTPAYMSPERANLGTQEADVRSDVYSLGVILYEMLTDDTPVSKHSLSKVSFVEALRMVAETHPVRPSLALARDRENRDEQRAPSPEGSGFRPRLSELKGDLDWIVMKAVAHEPGQRYESAAALAEDLERFLESRPVTARAPTVGYRMRKFARRHRTAVASLGVLALTLLAVAGFRGVQALREAGNGFERLMTAEIAAAPFLLGEVQARMGILRTALVEAAVDPDRPLRQRINANLALASERDAAVGDLAEALLDEQALGVDDLRAVQAALRAEAAPRELVQRAWAHVRDSSAERRLRLRSAALVSGVDASNPDWEEIAADVALLASGEGTLDLAGWGALLEGVAPRLLSPLDNVFERSRGLVAGSGAAHLLARFHRDDPEALADLLVRADSQQFGALLDAMRRLGPEAKPPLSRRFVGVLDEHPETDPPTEAEGDRRAQSVARAGLALIELGFGDEVWTMLARLRAPGDPRVRTWLIHGMATYFVHPRRVTERLAREQDPSVRAALLSALGDYDERVFPAELRLAMQDVLGNALSSPDPEEQAVAEWLVGQWSEHEIPRPPERIGGGASGETSVLTWRRSVHGLRMVHIPGPVEFLMGSPPHEAGRSPLEFQHPRTIEYAFEIADRPVTRQRYAECLERAPSGLELPPIDDLSGAGDGAPVRGFSLAEARRFCNLLSALEAIPEDQWFYGPDPDALPVGDPATLVGYRLPTEAEWEYACRANATTCRPFGSSNDLLPLYVHLRPRVDDPLPVARSRPNAFGLFDMLGSGFEYVDGPMTAYPGAPSTPLTLAPLGGAGPETFLRGAMGLAGDETAIRSAARNPHYPDILDDLIAVRPVRTVLQPPAERPPQGGSRGATD